MQEQHIYNLKEKMNKFEKVLTFKQKGFGREGGGGMKTRTEPPDTTPPCRDLDIYDI